MNKMIVVGAGEMGVAIAYGLLKLKYEVLLVDPDILALEKAKEKLYKLTGKNIESHQSSELPYHINCKTVISAAPFFSNYQLAVQAETRGMNYVDLGGDPATSNKIHALYLKNRKGIQCFTDVGLAPGLANIIAEHGYNLQKKNGHEKINDVHMMVGGLPFQRPNNLLRYNLTWSADGLYNEYVGKCTVLRNGSLIEVDALSELSYVNFDGYIPMENFYTKGGIGNTAHIMHSRGVKNCSYKTLRHPGHHKFVSFLIRDCKLKRDAFSFAIKNAAPRIKEDSVFIKVDVDTWNYEIGIFFNENWTAMQQTTGFSAAAIAMLVDNSFCGQNIVLSYQDVPFDSFIGAINQTELYL